MQGWSLHIVSFFSVGICTQLKVYHQTFVWFWTSKKSKHLSRKSVTKICISVPTVTNITTQCVWAKTPISIVLFYITVRVTYSHPLCFKTEFFWCTMWLKYSKFAWNDTNCQQLVFIWQGMPKQSTSKMVSITGDICYQ